MLPAYWRSVRTTVDREFSATAAYLQLRSIAALSEVEINWHTLNSGRRKSNSSFSPEVQIGK